jgi:chorismate mutase
MMTLVDIKEQLEAIDHKIINLLEERTHLCSGHYLGSDEEVEILSLWLEEAAEKGLDDVRMEKIAKLVITMCRDSAE